VAVPRAATETIAAIATAPGIGGIGIIRISGPDSGPILKRLFRPFRSRLVFESHKLYYGTVRTRSGEVLDEVLAVFMQAPHTYTREDVVEIHAHGSYLVLQAILSEVLAAGARPAESGEFTKRAFLAGRIDLTRAEAVVDLLDAGTNGAARLAVEQMQGGLYDRIVSVREALVEMLAVVEVALDFPDDDVEILQPGQLLDQLTERVEQPLEELIALADRGRVIREGVKAVIAGRPNVGKSSLLNGLLREERALVTEIPGTTRDTIEEMIAVHGIPVYLVDTAGIRNHDNLVEELGIERARRKLEEADLVLFVVDASIPLTRQDRELHVSIGGKKRVVVLNKCDIADRKQVENARQEFAGEILVETAAKHAQGLDELLEALYGQIVDSGNGYAEDVACAPNVRHRMILERALESCGHLRLTLQTGAPADLAAVDLQAVLDHLGDIVGLTTPDDVLDTVFSKFCIGK
jgi:tRNA modification GTPase